MIDAFLVPVDRLDSLKDRLSPYIDSYVETSYGRYDREDVFAAIAAGIFQIWVAIEEDSIMAVAMTQNITYPKLREVQIIMCCGQEYKKWFGLIDKIEQYAKDMNARKISAISRLGWKKIMLERGYENTHIYLEKDFCDGEI